MKKIFDYVVERRMSFSGTAKSLTEEGVPTRTGGNWTATTIKKIIHNRYTRGYFTHNGVELKGGHPPIVAEETWIAAQAIAKLGSKYGPRSPGRRPARHVFINRHARCADCGESLIPRSDYGDWYYCRTSKQLKGNGACQLPCLRREDVDGDRLRFVERSLLDVDATRDRIVAELDVTVRDTEEQLKRADREIAKLSGHSARLDADYLSGKLSAETFERFSARLSEETAAAVAERDRLRKHAEEARGTARRLDGEEETLRRLAMLRDASPRTRAPRMRTATWTPSARSPRSLPSTSSSPSSPAAPRRSRASHRV